MSSYWGQGSHQLPDSLTSACWLIPAQLYLTWKSENNDFASYLSSSYISQQLLALPRATLALLFHKLALRSPSLWPHPSLPNSGSTQGCLPTHRTEIILTVSTLINKTALGLCLQLSSQSINISGNLKNVNLQWETTWKFTCHRCYCSSSVI